MTNTAQGTAVISAYLELVLERLGQALTTEIDIVSNVGAL